MPRPDCRYCGKPLRRFAYDRPGQLGADGHVAEWGDYADNVFCGLRCGYRYGLIGLIAITR